MGEIAALPAMADKSGPTWEDFWTLYPRKVARKDARKAWDRLSEGDQLEAIVALANWRRVWLDRGDMEYIMHPATYLNGERWTDDLPSGYRKAPSTRSTTEIAPEPRGEIPAHVKAMIAKLRAKG